MSVHDGLIILVPLAGREEQGRLFGLVLDYLETLPDTMNTLIEIFSDGEIRMRGWSASDNDPGYASAPGRQP